MFEQIRQDLKTFMDESQKSQSKIAKETGLSTSAISQFMRGTYPGDNEEIESPQWTPRPRQLSF